MAWWSLTKALTLAAPSYILRSIAGKTFKIACILLSTAHVAKAHRANAHKTALVSYNYLIIFLPSITRKTAVATQSNVRRETLADNREQHSKFQTTLVARAEPHQSL